MRSLSRAVAQRGAVGRPLYIPWVALNQQVSLRTKELVVVAGAAGGGKSTLAANLAVASDEPVLYCAQDSPGSVLSRMAALTIGEATNTVQTSLARTSEQPGIVARVKEKARRTLIVNRGPVTTERLREMMEALTEWLGRGPSFVIIDNLIDMIVPGHGHHDTSFYAAVLPELKRLSFDYDTCVVVLHHVTRGGGTGHGRGQAPMNMNDLLYAGEREARHVWGVYNDGENIINVQVLKQQDGPADPNGDLSVPLQWLPVMGCLSSVAAAPAEW